MLSLLTPFQNKGKAQLEVKIGSVNGLLEGDRSKVRFVQTNMGRGFWLRRSRAPAPILA